MNHLDHVNLLRGAVASPGGVWADFGSGSGAFTLALADLVGPAGKIYSLDKDQEALNRQAASMRLQFPGAAVEYRKADFTRLLDLPVLDGAVMANSLHFVAPHRKPEVVKLVKGYLKAGGRLVLVEYNVDAGNLWVPYPISYKSWETLARTAGFDRTELLARVPSRFLREIYSAQSW
jgi:ubiquinone/menaquinone biosynthesis C-methylase UbiE